MTENPIYVLHNYTFSYILYVVYYVIEQAPEQNILKSSNLRVQSVNSPETSLHRPFSYHFPLNNYVSTMNLFFLSCIKVAVLLKPSCM